MTRRAHEHYDPDLDRRWPCAADPCVRHDVAKQWEGSMPATRPLTYTAWDLAAVLALDLGLSTGWAMRLDGRLESGTEVFQTKRDDSPGLRYVRFNTWLREVTVPLIDTVADGRLGLIAYEQAHHRGGAATEVLAGLTTRVQEHCARWQLQHVSVHSNTLKRWVAGHGNASKDDIADAVARRGWLPTGVHATALTDDELDAIGLLHYVEAEVLGGKVKP